MKTRLLVPGVVLALLVSFGAGVQPAQAESWGDVVMEGYTLTCSSFQATGTVGSGSIVVIWAEWYEEGLPNSHLYIAKFPITNGRFNGQVNFPAAPTGTVFWAGVEGWNGWSGEYLECPATSAVDGPPIPAGFVLKTVTCDVAVFDTPGGKPVGSNAIKAGQTWYVNPTPKKDAAGKSWTEIFVAGYSNGFVPTSCVR